MSQCRNRSCLYYGCRTETCDYLLITGERRGCPVEDCARYVPNASVRRLVDYYSGKGKLSEQDRRLLDLYEQGLSDREIARRAERSCNLVWHWRSKMGLLPNFGRRDDED